MRTIIPTRMKPTVFPIIPPPDSGIQDWIESVQTEVDQQDHGGADKDRPWTRGRSRSSTAARIRRPRPGRKRPAHHHRSGQELDQLDSGHGADGYQGIGQAVAKDYRPFPNTPTPGGADVFSQGLQHGGTHHSSGLPPGQGENEGRQDQSQGRPGVDGPAGHASRGTQLHGKNWMPKMPNQKAGMDSPAWRGRGRPCPAGCLGGWPPMPPRGWRWPGKGQRRPGPGNGTGRASAIRLATE